MNFLSNNSLYDSNVFTTWGTSAHRLEGILSFSFHIDAAPRSGVDGLPLDGKISFGSADREKRRRRVLETIAYTIAY